MYSLSGLSLGCLWLSVSARRIVSTGRPKARGRSRRHGTGCTEPACVGRTGRFRAVGTLWCRRTPERVNASGVSRDWRSGGRGRLRSAQCAPTRRVGNTARGYTPREAAPTSTTLPNHTRDTPLAPSSAPASAEAWPQVAPRPRGMPWRRPVRRRYRCSGRRRAPPAAMTGSRARGC